MQEVSNEELEMEGKKMDPKYDLEKFLYRVSF
jgi:hypothetical protein